MGEVLNLKNEGTWTWLRASLMIVGKFGKTRLVPIHSSTQKGARQIPARTGSRIGWKSGLLFRLPTRQSPGWRSGAANFSTGSPERSGLRGLTASHGPRLHDFRHRFRSPKPYSAGIVSGQDVERRMPVLSTYLGHGHVSDTYWYLTICPELMGLVVKRLEKHWDDAPMKSNEFFAPLLERFFIERLMRQRQVSPPHGQFLIATPSASAAFTLPTGVYINNPPISCWKILTRP